MDAITGGAKMNWQDISTAPKDGTHFLSTSQHLDGEIFICTWKDKTLHHGTYKEHHVGWWLVGIPKRYYAGWGPLYMPIKMDDLQPTHWMPFPLPPNEQEWD
jgi:hypothetical protein